MSNHTIVLLQTSAAPSSRQYSDFESQDKAMDGICQMFEEKLKRENPQQKKITYDISDLFSFIDKLTDLAALVFDPKISAYVPHNKKWIQDAVFAHLQRQAGQA